MDRRRRTPAATALIRGLVKRCPRCGAGGLFTRWFTMAPSCPRCGLAFERTDGFWLGAMAINLAVAEVLLGVFGLVAIVLTWPHTPWALLTVGAVALNAVAPIVFYPYSKTIFLAIDLLLHEVDNAGAHELGSPRRRPAETSPR